MAASMQDVKRRIKSVNSMEHITNAMKLVSAAKLRRAKATFEKTNEHFHYVTHSIAEIFNNAPEVPENYLAGNREIENTCYIIMTSSKGLCGAFNSNVIKEAERQMKGDRDHSLIVAVGSKGKDYFRKRGYTIYSEYLDPPETISFLDTQVMSKPIIEMYNSGEVDEVVLIYTSYVSTLTQEAKSVRLLPFEVESDPEIIINEKEVEYEPSVEAVFNYLVPKYVEIMIYGALVESATTEHAARRMAMENATDNAREMIEDLSLFYNRARQAAITNQINEIVGGSEAQK